MIHLLLVLAIFGFIGWLITQIPMPSIFRNIIIGIMSILAILWALQVFGVHTGFPRVTL